MGLRKSYIVLLRKPIANARGSLIERTVKRIEYSI